MASLLSSVRDLKDFFNNRRIVNHTYSLKKFVASSREGLNPVYYLAGLGILKFMERYPSVNFRKAFTMVSECRKEFELRLNDVARDPLCLDPRILKKHLLLKEKHYAYAGFLATASTLPILHRVAANQVIQASIFSKTALATGIKLLDNVNDSLHGFDQAVESQRKYEYASTQDSFHLTEVDGNDGRGWITKAENSTYLMARWAYQHLGDRCESETFKLFKEHVRENVNAQINSFYQKFNGQDSSFMSLRDYMKKVSPKGIGKIWVGVDFCFYEKAVGGLDGNDRKAIELINRGLDLVFRSLLFYDDVTDLREDLSNKIINSVPMLGVEKGKLSLSEFYRSDNSLLIKKLEEQGLTDEIIDMGNMVFLKGVDSILKAKDYSYFIDIEALIFCARILRLFLLRKHVLEKRNIRSLGIFMQSLSDFDKMQLSIPQHTFSYGKLLD